MPNKGKAAGVATPSGREREQTVINCDYSTTSRAACQGNNPLHGKVQGTTWRKMASMSRHLLQTPKAWAVDLLDLERAESMGARFVEIYELEHKVTYRTSVTILRAKGQKLNRSFGVQLALPLCYWSTTDECRDPGPLQLRFGGGL
jgi:hypothetical protein